MRENFMNLGIIIFEDISLVRAKKGSVTNCHFQIFVSASVRQWGIGDQKKRSCPDIVKN